MTWVYNIPLWLAVAIFVGGFCLISGGGLAITRRRIARDAEITHNDVAGVIVGAIGTVLAVLLSFMVVTVWQQHDEAANIAQREAYALADMYYATTALPQPIAYPLQADIAAYLNATINEEWPLMRRGEESKTAERLAVAIVHLAQNIQPQNAGQSNIQSDLIALAHAFIDARRDRLFNNRLSIPPLIWVSMIFVALVMIALSYLFYVSDARTHMIMMVALGAVVGVTFLMIAELDLPFRGAIQVPPSALEHVRAYLPSYLQ